MRKFSIYCFLASLLFLPVHVTSAQTFNSARILPVLGVPMVIATGDFNRDGRPDIVYQDSYTGGNLHVMAGLGDGTFSEVQQIALPPAIGARITVADLNNDGFPDLIVGYDGDQSNFTPAEVAALLNRGDGTFAPPIFSSFPIYAGPDAVANHIAVADFDGDGHTDFIFSASAGILLMQGDGAGHFAARVLLNRLGDSRDVYVADFNEDGKPDISFNSDFAIYFSLNTGGGNFGSAQILANVLTNPPSGFSTADVNSDGHQDILYGYNGSLWIAYGKGDGTFAAPRASGAARIYSNFAIIAVQDVNGDARPDIVTSNYSGPVVQLQDASGKFSDPYASGPAVGDLGLLAPVFADFDGDGIGDIVSGATGALVFSKGRSDGTFNGAQATTVGSNVLDVQPADFNLDHLLDVAITVGGGSYYGALYTYLGDGTGRFTEAGYAGSYATFAGQSSISDFNGDGVPDVFNAGYALNGDGQGYFLPAQLIAAPPSGNRPYGFTAIADFNEDGRPDPVTGTVAISGPSGATLAVGLSAGANAWNTTQIHLPAPVGPLIAADLNNDGHKDLAAASNSNIFIILGDGRGNFTLTQTIPIGYTAGTYYGIQSGQNDLEAADLDGDGNIDLLVPIADKNVIQIFYGRGDGTFEPAVSLPTAQDVRYVTVFDMDKDGIQDLILGGHALVRILHGIGHRAFEAVPSQFAANPFPQKVRVADVNGDGNFDLLVPNGGYSSIVEPGYGFTVLINDAPAATPDLLYASAICLPEPSAAGQPFSCTATFKPANNPASPTGYVTFTIDGSPAGTATLNAQKATFLFPASISPGHHIIEVDFPGDLHFRASTTSIVHTITPASALISLSGPNHVAFGQNVTLVAALSGALGLPTGNITFIDGISQVAQSALANGAASFSTATLAAGTHSFQASYGGDATYASGLSNIVSIIVDPTPTQTVLQATPLTAPFGSSVSLQATVSAPVGPLSGTVTFLDGTTPLGSVSVSPSGVAQLQLSTLTLGTHTIIARFDGSASFAGSTSSAVQIVITGILTSATLSATPNPSYPGQTVTFLATISAATAPQSFTGTVRCFDGSAALADVPVTTGGVATFTSASLNVGTHAIVAKYLGGGVLVPAQSNVVQQIVLDSSFSMIAIPSQLSLQTEHHTTFKVSVTPLGLFNGPVVLTCGPVPEHATCQISPTSVSLTPNSGTQSASVYLDTSDVIGYAGNGPAPLAHHNEQFFATLFLPSLAAFGLVVRRRRSFRHLRLLALALSFVTAASLSLGCSGMYPASVAPGIYTISINGSSNTAISQSATLILTVTH